MARKKQDALMVQVSLQIGLPRGRKVKVSKKALQGILDLMVAGKKLPKNVTVRGIYWRNPGRKGKGGAWRYHEGAALTGKGVPRPLEEHPREPDWEATIPSLGPFIEIGGVTF